MTAASGEMPAEVRELYERARDPAEPAPPPEAAGEAPNSRIAALREQHRRIGRQHSTVIAFPHWAGKLGARFRYLDDKGLRRLMAVAGSEDVELQMRVSADVIISGCEELLFREDEGADWEPLIDGEQIRFDRRLVDALALTRAGDTARSVLEALWDNPAQAALAIGEIGSVYLQWLRGRAPEVAEQTLGEPAT